MGLAEKTDQKTVASAPPRRRTALARWISAIVHPVAFPLLTLALVAYGATKSLQGTLPFIAAALLLTSLPISLFVGAQVVTGRWTDLDVSVRRQRYALYPFGLACMLALTLAFIHLDAPRILVRATLAFIVANMLDGLINLVYKVSAHATTAALCAAFLVLAFPLLPAVGVAAVVAALAVGWSRVELGRHTTGQVLLGWLVGIASALAVQLLFV